MAAQRNVEEQGEDERKIHPYLFVLQDVHRMEETMSIFLEEEGTCSLDLDCEMVAALVIETVLEDLSCPYEVEVNLLLTDDEEIREMNRMYRNIDRATDVLSFPMVDFGQVQAFEDLEGSDDCFHPESGELLLGDIVISKEHVLAQADTYGHSVKREFAFLIAHSMLHLFGYDHMEDQERLVMEEKQGSILDKIKITR